MATEDTEAGGQTEDTGDSSDESTESTDEGEQQAARGDSEKPTGQRDKRRANRFKEEREGRERAERALAESSQRTQQLEREFNEFRQQVERDRQAAQQSDASAQTKEKVRSLREQARTFLLRSAQSKDPAEAQKLLDRHDELMDEADDMRASMRDEASWQKRRGEIAGSIPNPDVQREASYLESKYPQVVENEEAQALASARFSTLVNKQGMPKNRATMEAAITWAMARLGIGGRSAPSENSRRAYMGTGQRDGEQDNSESSGSMSVEEVKNNIAFKRMAQLAYPQLEAEQAYVKWARDVGSKAKQQNGV